MGGERAVGRERVDALRAHGVGIDGRERIHLAGDVARSAARGPSARLRRDGRRARPPMPRASRSSKNVIVASASQQTSATGASQTAPASAAATMTPAGRTR
jgi:hypothetical protein